MFLHSNGSGRYVPTGLARISWRIIMARRYRYNQSEENKLMLALEKGKSPKGMEGFTDVLDDVFAPIRIKELKVSCGITVVAEIVGGYGEFDIEPCRFFDEIPDIKAQQEYDKKLEERENWLSKIRNAPTYTRRLSFFHDLFGRLSDDQREEILQEIRVRKSDPEKVPTHIIQDLVPLMADMYLGLDTKEDRQ
jgi:hypothetical protein